MSIRVRLKYTGETGTAYNLNGADQTRVDWYIDDDSLDAQARLKITPVADMNVEIDNSYLDLAQAIESGVVVVDESNGGLDYGYGTRWPE